MTHIQKLRAELVERLESNIVVRLQPTRVTEWADGGSEARTMGMAETSEDAEKKRREIIASRLDSWDAMMVQSGLLSA